MAAILAGDRLTPKQKSRATLSVRSPLVNSLLGGLSIDGEDINEAYAFGKQLVDDRNEWDIARRRTGLFGGGRLSKADAGLALSRALSALADSEVVR